MKFTPKLPDGNVNITKIHPFKEMVVLLGGIGGIVICLYILAGFLVPYAVEYLPKSIEKQIAGIYVPDADNTETGKYLQAIAEKIRLKLPDQEFDYHVTLSASTDRNAVAMLGGRIVIFSGLLEILKTENQAAFVIAHEIGHIRLRHHLKRMGRSLIIGAIASVVLGPDNGITSFVMKSASAVELKFSKKEETEADLFAVDMLEKVYGHTSGATVFFEELERSENIAGFTLIMKYFSDHPSNTDRIDAVNHYIKEKNYSSGKELLFKSDYEQ